MTWTKALMVAGGALSLTVGAVSTWALPKNDGPSVVVSQRGRDQEAFRLVQSAKRTITVRTECLSMLPFANELGQAQQRGVKVSVFLPIDDGVRDARIGNFLSHVGAVVQWQGDSITGNHRGAYLEIDGERFLYSAAPLTLAVPGANVGYVSGPISR